MDKLKNHIEENREDFELFPFEAESGWNEIAGKVSRKERIPRWQWMSIAACVALLVVMGSFTQWSRDTSDELTEVEQYYQSEINYKVSLVKSQLSDPSILEDLESMDQAFAELKADLKDNVDNEEVVVAMMENYQLKLQILEEILVELEKEKRENSL